MMEKKTIQRTSMIYASNQTSIESSERIIDVRKGSLRYRNGSVSQTIRPLHSFLHVPMRKKVGRSYWIYAIIFSLELWKVAIFPCQVINRFR